MNKLDYAFKLIEMLAEYQLAHSNHEMKYPEYREKINWVKEKAASIRNTENQ